MKLGVIRRILKEDLEAVEPTPRWIDAMLEPLNDFISTLSQALTNNVTFPDNLSGKKFAIKFTHGRELSINPTTKTQVRGVFVYGVDSWGSDSTGTLPTVIQRYGWVQKANGNIGLTFYFYAFEARGTTTSASASLASVSPVTNVRAGMYVTGSGIPIGTTVLSVSGSTVTMSQNATASLTTNQVIFSPAQQTVTFFFLTE